VEGGKIKLLKLSLIKMTKVIVEKFTCHVCGTEYEGPHLLSWNSMMGKPDMKPLACPKCGAPAEIMHPKFKTGIELDILLTVADDTSKATALLSENSHNDGEVDELVKSMLKVDLGIWRHSGDEILKYAETHNDEKTVSKIKIQNEKIDKLKELSGSGALATLMNEMAIKAKGGLKEKV